MWVALLADMAIRCPAIICALAAMLLAGCMPEGGTTSSRRPGMPGTDAGRPPPTTDDAGLPDPPMRDPDASVPPDPDAGPHDPPPGRPYPSGPYGTREGRVMPDLWFLQPDGAEVRWSDIRSDRSVKLIFWASGAGWCGSCIDAVPDIIELHNRYSSRGLYVMESVFQDESYRMATPAYAGEWKRRFGCPYMVTAEPDPSYGEASAIPMVWLIDAETMNVIYFGNDIYGIDRMIDSAL